jgi:hypothetical protein
MSSSKNKLTPTQTRAARRTRRQNRSKITKYAIGAAAIGVAVLLILGLILPMLGGLGNPMTGAPDGPGKKIEDLGSYHIGEGEEHPDYNSIPATSGWHYAQPLAPVSWGVHKDFIPDEKKIHNLEHGGISITYNCPSGCDELVKSLADIVERGRTEGMELLLSPHPGTEKRIALTAWAFIDHLDPFDKDRIINFIDAHHNSPNAPETQAR